MHKLVLLFFLDKDYYLQKHKKVNNEIRQVLQGGRIEGSPDAMIDNVPDYSIMTQ